MKIYRAYYDSRNFCFEAYSQTKNSAKYHLLQALKRHGEQYDLEADWYMIGDADGIEVDVYEADQPYRDRSIVKEMTNA
jgi:hypothetical protein